MDSDSSLKLKTLLIPVTRAHIYCDISTEKAHPYITAAYRRATFEMVHNHAHPSIKPTADSLNSDSSGPRSTPIAVHGRTHARSAAFKGNLTYFHTDREFPPALSQVRTRIYRHCHSTTIRGNKILPNLCGSLLPLARSISAG